MFAIATYTLLDIYMYVCVFATLTIVSSIRFPKVRIT